MSRQRQEELLTSQKGSPSYQALLAYLRNEYEIAKEALVDDGSEVARGEALRLRKLIKTMTREDLKELTKTAI